MAIWKKAISTALSAALLASLLATAVAPSAFAATLTNIVYQANGAVAGSTVGNSASVAFVSFNPVAPLQAGTNITLTLPSGTTTAAPTFTMQQIGGAVVAAPTVAAGNIVTITIPVGAPGTTGAGVTIYKSGGTVTNPTILTSNPTLGIAIQNGDTGTLPVTFVAGPAASLALSPLTPSVVANGGLQQFTAICSDAFTNVTSCPAITWTQATLVGGTGAISGTGLYTAGALGTVTVTANAGAGPLTQATVVTNVASTAAVACSPVAGTIAAGSTVTCTFAPGTPAAPNPTWTQTNFTPAGPVAAPGATFTAVNAGTTPVVGTIAVTGSVTTTFSYVINPTAVPPTASGTWPGTPAGNVAQNTTSAGTATLLLTENAKDALKTTGTMTVTIVPAAPGVGTVEWAGTPVLSAPDSLGATVSIAGNQLIIKIKAFDNLNVEPISISGLKIKASANASPGNVVATLSDSAGGAIYGAFVPTTVTATGKLQNFTGVGASGFNIALDTGSCSFDSSATVARPLKIAGSSPESITSANIGALSGGLQVVSAITPVTTVNHDGGTAVTQTVNNCNASAIGSPAKVVTAAKFTYSGTPTVFPGESNAPAGDLQVVEPAAGFLAKDTVLTFTIATAGVVFSKVPVAVNAGGGIAYSAPVLSADRKTVTLTITTASTTATQVWLGNTASPFNGTSPVLYDVAASVPGGTYVDVNLTLSGGLLVTGNPAQNAIVFRGIDASAPTPIVYIGENNQATGLVTLTEKSAGIFNSGTGSNNVIAVCTLGVNYSYTFAPWAKVTVGDLRLREGAVASPDNIVAGSLDSTTGCYTWTVWTASTTASTIVIGNDTFSTGPLINVRVNQAPGIVLMDIYSGNSLNYDDQLIATVGFAIAAFRNQVAVTALSQPTIPAGAVTKAGAIQIAETANGQLKNNEEICFEILARGSAANVQAKYDTLISALNTAQLPIVTASGGLVVGPVRVSNANCAGANVAPSNLDISFSFTVLQQSTAGTGKLVVDNINLLTLADAASGPVLFNVFGYGGSPTSVQFQAQVSNAKIGVKAAVVISSDSALGLMPNQGPWTTATKVQKLKGYVTWRFTAGSALAGKLVQIQVAAKNSSGGWGAFGTLTSAKVDSSGVAYFQWRQKTPAWLSARAYYPGDISLAESWSPARQARWR